MWPREVCSSFDVCVLVVSVEGGMAKAPGAEMVEKVQKEGLEWKRRAKEAEQALKKYGINKLKDEVNFDLISLSC